MGDPVLRDGPFAALDARTAYRLWALRESVFVVEQACAYQELDGRDTDPATVHLWAEDDGDPVAYLRVVEEEDRVARIGRVLVAVPWRGRGLAETLVRRAERVIGDRPTRLDAQSYLEGWYTRLGYVRGGPEFVEDGIPHVPMHRPG